MRGTDKIRGKLKRWLGITALGGVVMSMVACQTPPEPKPVAYSSQQIFPTPESAMNALADATRRDDIAALQRILGAQAEKLIHSGDPIADKNGREKFTAAYDTRHQLEAKGGDTVVIEVGSEEWPLPIPLVRQNGGWVFATSAGEQEILNRRIGRNELNVIEVCRAYVMAQREYAYEYKHPSGHKEFAQRFMSSADTHDGLYWPAAEGERQSPLGSLMAQAQSEGYQSLHGDHRPYHGYYFRILKQQGADAAGGAKDYIVNGHMDRGFALIAIPATYGDSGVKTFIVNQNGIVYEKDIGANTAEAARAIEAYNPDESWTPSP